MSAAGRTVLALLLLAACGGGGDGDVLYGETTFVIVVNPVVNDDNQAVVPPPGLERDGVDLFLDDGSEATTDLGGVAVLAGVEAGSRTLTLVGADIDAEVSLDIGEGDLVEVAVAADGADAAIMSEVVWDFDDQVIEIDPEMSIDDVNQALSESGVVVFIAGGTYPGDLVFSGSDVSVFGEGPLGGRVILDGNVTIEGSGNRMRGADIQGDLDVPGSNASLSFSWVEGATTVDGSGGVLLYNDFCGPVTIAGSGVTALDDLGMSPLPPPDGC